MPSAPPTNTTSHHHQHHYIPGNPEYPWSRIHVDFGGPFLGEMFLPIVDTHSKWMDIYPVTSATSQVTIEKLHQSFSVTTNVSVRQWNLFHKLGEKVVQTFKEGMKGETLQTRLSWFLFSYRITPHATTGDKVFIRNYSYGPKFIPAVVMRSSGPVSYTVITGSGQVVKRHVDQVRARLADTAPSSEPENDLELVWDTDKETVDPVTSEKEEPPASEPVEWGTPVLPDLTVERAVQRSERDRRLPAHLKDFVK
ncbi:hypothetical protein L3Q82_017741 [Scortum barcoo]|uniref:Uncharacterized protein n=1 Tax=Scortum barcoo TaxID=214431 RepID=A0ACB8VM23_9TELE|nr:hypothetical protein L3Q82_017741 [Scortum barcoo]